MAYALIYSDKTKIQNHKVILSALILSMCTITRSTGTLCAAVPLYYTGHKIVREIISGKPSLLKGAKYVFTILITVIIVGAIPVLTITSWKPYELYCLSRLEQENGDHQLPEWCLESIPNVYTYIQKVYW